MEGYGLLDRGGPEAWTPPNSFIALLKAVSPGQRKSLHAAITKATVPLTEEQASARLRKDQTGYTGLFTGSGVVPYAMESPAMYLWPVVTILRNMLARNRKGGVGYHYKQITKLNAPTKLGFASEATTSTDGRAGFVTFDEKEKSVTFKKVGADQVMSTEEELGSYTLVDGENFQAPQLAALLGLYGAMIAEERCILGGNQTALTAAALGTPSLTYSTAGEPAITQPTTNTGSLTAATAYYTRVSALSYEGYVVSATGNGGADARGETDATTQVTFTTAASGAGNLAYTFGWAAVKGAVAYNVYVSLVNGSGWKYQKTVFKNRATIGLDDNGASQALITTGNTVNTADTSGNTAAFDGFYTLVPTQGSYDKNLGGAALTGDGTTGCNEFEAIFLSLFQNYQVGCSQILISPTDKFKLDKIMLAGTTGPVWRVNLQGTSPNSNIIGGITATGMLNRYTQEIVDIVVHPYMAPGTILFCLDQLGKYYPAANVPACAEMALGWDYTRFDFPVPAMKKEWGTYLFGAPVLRVPFVFASLRSVG